MFVGDYDAVDDQLAHVCADRINEWLCRWHAWSRAHVHSTGFYGVNPACRQSRASRQYDDENGSLDAHIESVEMEAVDAVMDAIPQPWRTALSVQARNLYTGASVWVSPRLPACQRERAVLLMEARNKFHLAMLRANIF